MNETPASTIRIYSPAQVGVACLLGSPVAAGCLMALTYGALRDAKNARRWLVVGVIATLLEVAVAVYLPASFQIEALPIVTAVGIYFVARRLHGQAVAAQRARGERIGSWGFVVAVGFLGLGIVGAAIVGIGALLLAG